MRGRWTTWRRRGRPAVLLLVAAALAVVTRLVGGDVRLRVVVAPWLLVLEVGVLAGVAWWAVSWWARRRRAAEDRAVEHVRRSGEAARRRFVGRLDHELKNPLTALLAVVGGGDGPLGAAERSIARVQAGRLARLLEDLRRVPEVELVDLDLVACDVEQLLEEAVGAAVEDDGASRAVRIDVPRAPRPLPALVCDPDLVAVALSNVVANALKYSGPGDDVEVRARESADQEGMLVVEVADAGPGIPAVHQDDVWEELARGPAPPGVPGSGIGLALVRAVAARHGGRAELRSRDGEGTSVFLHLPFAGPVRDEPGRPPGWTTVSDGGAVPGRR